MMGTHDRISVVTAAQIQAERRTAIMELMIIRQNEARGLTFAFTSPIIGE
jgi:hypothetical protein